MYIDLLTKRKKNAYISRKGIDRHIIAWKAHIGINPTHRKVFLSHALSHNDFYTTHYFYLFIWSKSQVPSYRRQLYLSQVKPFERC